MKREIMEGRSFGNWEVLRYDGCYDRKKSYYICKCKKCGTVHRVRADKLKSGGTSQCLSCAARDRWKARKGIPASPRPPVGGDTLVYVAEPPAGACAFPKYGSEK